MNQEDGEKFFDRALSYKREGKFDLAEEYYQLAIKHGVSEAYNNLALLYEEQGYFVMAGECYKKAIQKGNYEAISNLEAMYKNKLVLYVCLLNLFQEKPLKIVVNKLKVLDQDTDIIEFKEKMKNMKKDSICDKCGILASTLSKDSSHLCLKCYAEQFYD